MTQITQPANGRKVQFLFTFVHFTKFLFPVLIGGLAFCIGVSMEVSLPMGWIVTLLVAFPIVVFFLFPIFMKVTKLSIIIEKLPTWIPASGEWVILCVYTWLLGVGFQINHQEITRYSVWSMMWTALLILSAIFVLLYLSRQWWMDFLPTLQTWEGRIRLISFGFVLIIMLWGFIAKQPAPAILTITLLVIMGLSLSLTLLRLSRERESGESFFREVSGFVFLAFGFVMLLLSVG